MEKVLAKISVSDVSIVPQCYYTGHRFKNHSLLGINYLLAFYFNLLKVALERISVPLENKQSNSGFPRFY